MMVIGAAFYLLVYTEAPRVPITCAVAVVQGWITYAVFAPFVKRPDPFEAFLMQGDPPAITWLGIPFLLVATLGLGYLGLLSWRRAQD